jgi:hypothetical protein
MEQKNSIHPFAIPEISMCSQFYGGHVVSVSIWKVRVHPVECAMVAVLTY